MLLIDKLQVSDNFSDSEQKIAQYVLDNAQDVTGMTIYELSDKTYSSTATITRFCRKLELEGFSDLKIQLAKELSTFSLSDKRIAQDTPFTKVDAPQDIAQSILNLNIQSLLDTYNHIDVNQLNRIAKMIAKTESVFIYGRGQSLILAEEFQYKLLRIGISASVALQDGFQGMTSFAQPKNSAAIMISYYGVSSYNLDVIKALKSRGITVVLITGPNKNPLINFANEVVHVPSHEELMVKMASYSSRAAMQLVIDIIYALVFSYDYDRNSRYVRQV